MSSFYTLVPMLFEQIQMDIKEAMRAKNTLALLTLRSILAAMKNELVAGVKKDTLSDEESIKILKKLAKQRKDSMEQYNAGNRSDLAEKEEAELHIILGYLPEEMSADALKIIITDTIAAHGSNKKSDMGLLMKKIIPMVQGKADGSAIKNIMVPTI